MYYRITVEVEHVHPRKKKKGSQALQRLADSIGPQTPIIKTQPTQQMGQIPW